MAPYINASEIASLIDCHKYQPWQETVIKIIQRNYPQIYTNICNRSHKVNRDAQVEVCVRYQQNEILKAQQTHVDSNQQIIEQNVISTEEYVKLMSNEAIANSVKKEAVAIKGRVDGILKESTDLDYASAQIGTDITERNTSMHYLYDDNFVMGGKIDGLSMLNGEKVVIENKHRRNRLFRRLVLYEKIQIFMYMKLTGATKGILVENYNNKQARHTIEWNEEYWNELYYSIIEKMNYIQKLIQSESLQDELINLLES